MDRRIRVLIADDSSLSRNGLRALLNVWPGIDVVGEVANGGEAVRLAEQVQPSVVLMDARMPQVDGVQATRCIKTRWPGIKVIMLTMYSTYRIKALEAGADIFLVKGCSTDELLEAITGTLPGWEKGSEDGIDQADRQPFCSLA